VRLDVTEPNPSDDPRLAESAEALRRLVGQAPRPLAVIAGSGLSRMSEALEVERRMPMGDIACLPRPKVSGHTGTLVAGRLAGIPTLLFGGRVHLYEGWSADEVVASVRLAEKLGARILLITNASGGVGPFVEAGDLMLITNQIDLTLRRSAGGGGNASKTDGALSDRSPYDPTLGANMLEAAREAKIILKTGVYVGSLGPTYETRAESTMLRKIGADAVGMSTVLEVAAARRVGIRVVGVSCIANRVPVWGDAAPVAHDEVVERVGAAGERLKRLILRWGERLAHDANG
jgi:purine-nucleoside phosphorylase